MKMADNLNHGFWDIPQGSDTPKKSIYPPHMGRACNPAQRKENIQWAEEMGGVRFDESYNPTYVIFKDCIYNAYNQDRYRPSYFQNKWNISLYKMTRGLRKDQKDDVVTTFSWTHLQQVYQPKNNFPKP